MILELGDRHKWVTIKGSDRVSYVAQDFVKPGKNGRMSKIKCVYIGFATYREAMRYARSCRKRCFVRASERSLDWEYEVKIQGDFGLDEVEAIASSIDKFFPVSFGAVISKPFRSDERGTGRTTAVTLGERRRRALVR